MRYGRSKLVHLWRCIPAVHGNPSGAGCLPLSDLELCRLCMPRAVLGVSMSRVVSGPHPDPGPTDRQRPVWMGGRARRPLAIEPGQ